MEQEPVDPRDAKIEELLTRNDKLARMLIAHNDRIQHTLHVAVTQIKVNTLREAAKTFGECVPEGEYTSSPAEVIEWLNNYADEFEKLADADG